MRDSVTIGQSGPITSQNKLFVSNQPTTSGTQTPLNNNILPGNPPQEWELSLPSKQQLIARKSVNTELPIFNGKAEDWTCFISCYEMTTYVCGFNNVDNLIRLKRCLKGEAYDSVRHRLNLPRFVQKSSRS